MNLSWFTTPAARLAADPWSGTAVVAGFVCALAAAVSGWLPLVGLVGILGLGALVYLPGATIFLLFAAILLDSTTLTSVAVAGVPLTGSKLSVLLAAGIHLLRVSLDRSRPLLRYHPIVGSILMIVGSMMVSMAAAGRVDQGYVATLSMVMLGCLVMLVDVSVDQRGMVWLPRAMAAAVITALSHAILNTDYAVAKGGNADSAWATRAAGTLEDPNEWCAMLVLVVPLCAGLLVRDRAPISDFLRLVMLLLYPVAVVQSFSRGGFIGLVLTLPGLLYMNWRNRTLFLIALAIFITLAPALLNLEAVFLRYQTIINPELESDLGHQSMNERSQLLRAAFDVYVLNPFLGVGVGLFPLHASYVTAGGVWKIAHNTYLSIAAEQGTFGLAIHGIFVGYVVRAVRRAARYGSDPQWRDAAVGIGTGLLGFAFMALTLNLLEFAMLHFILGMLVFADRLAVDPETLSVPPPNAGRQHG